MLKRALYRVARRPISTIAATVPFLALRPIAGKTRGPDWIYTLTPRAVKAP